MTDTWVTPRVWVAGEKVTASKKNEDSNNFRVLWPYTATGDIAYKDGAGAYLSKVAKPASLGILQNDATGVPSYFTGGSALQLLRKNAGNTAFEWAALSALIPSLTQRQGGSPTIWTSPGTTNYTPVNPIMKSGYISITFSASVAGNVAVTYPTTPAFTQRPAILLSAEMSSLVSYNWSLGHTDDSVNGFTFHVKWTSAVSGTYNFGWFAIGQ
jgi:hypothetical protein